MKSLLSLALAALPVCAQPYLISAMDQNQGQSSSGAHYIISGTGGQNFVNIRLTYKAPTGSCIVVGFLAGDNTNIFTVTDDGSNTYSVGKYQTDTSGNGPAGAAIFYSCGIATAAQKITITASTAVDLYGLWAANFGGTATSSALDGSCGQFATSTTINCGGNLSSITSGDLVIGYAFNDGAGTGATFAPGSQSNITWNLLAADQNSANGAQWGVYSSSSAFDPAMSQSGASNNGYVYAAIAIKAGSGGTAPTGIYVNSAKHWWLDSNKTYPYTDNFACPSSDNAMYIAWSGVPTDSLSGVSDSHSQTWTTTGSHVVSPDGVTTSSIGYKYMSATTSNTQTITLSGTNTSANAISYCISGAGTWDHRTSATGDQTVAGNLTTVAYTPNTSSGVMIASANWAANSATGVTCTGCVFTSGFNGDETGGGVGGVDQDSGNGLFVYSSTTSVTWTWSFVSGSNSVGDWAAIVDGFEAPTSTVVRHRAMVIQSK